jgi:hypothetical protein
MKVKDYLVNNIIHMIDIKDNFSMLEIASMFLEKKIDSLIITEDEKPIYI